jgi:hypothetical protein
LYSDLQQQSLLPFFFKCEIIPAFGSFLQCCKQNPASYEPNAFNGLML